MGPMSGRAAGFCAGFTTPGYASPVGGRGCGRGLGGSLGGGGRGWRNQFHATGLPGWRRGMAGGDVTALAAPEPEQELAALKQQVEALEKASASLRQRLQELDTKPVEK